MDQDESKNEKRVFIEDICQVGRKERVYGKYFKVAAVGM